MSDSLPDIQIPNIEKELNPSKNQQSDRGAQQKACLFTLIIFASEARSVAYLQELVDTILDKFPCRIIFIEVDDQATNSYCHVSVSNITSGVSTGASSPAISCDQILIKASKDQLFRIPFIVIPHIVPDLPLYLLWGQNPFEEREVFPHLQPYASRVIFDSECSDNLSSFCTEMQRNLDVLKMDIMDVSWALTSSWRDLLAQLFDTPKKCEQLEKIKSVIIHYNNTTTASTQHPEIRALYLQAWLACCLKWKYNNISPFNTDVVISYLGSTHPSVVALSPQSLPDLPPGAINSIEITTLDNYSYVILRKQNISQALIHISSPETCELPFTLLLPNVHKGLAFMREIFFGSLGSHYREMLHMISNIDDDFFRNGK